MKAWCILAGRVGLVNLWDNEPEFSGDASDAGAAYWPSLRMAAIYLHEYVARQWLTRLIRIAVSNLVGVQTIVYGIFGLRFFIYAVSGSLDTLLCWHLAGIDLRYPGLLRAALTLVFGVTQTEAI